MKYYQGPADLHFDSGRTIGLTRVEIEERVSNEGLTQWGGMGETGIITGVGEAELEFPNGERARVLVTNAHSWNGWSMLTLLGNGKPPVWSNLW